MFFKDNTRTLRRCRLLNKMKGMTPTRELCLRRRPQTGARKCLTRPTPEKDNVATPEVPCYNIHVSKNSIHSHKIRLRMHNALRFGSLSWHPVCNLWRDFCTFFLFADERCHAFAFIVPSLRSMEPASTHDSLIAASWRPPCMLSLLEDSQQRCPLFM